MFRSENFNKEQCTVVTRLLPLETKETLPSATFGSFKAKIDQKSVKYAKIMGRHGQEN